MNKIETNLYELNKTLVTNLKPVDREVAKAKVKDFFVEQLETDKLNENYMLLAAEKRDFTVFRFRGIEAKLDEMAEEIVQVVESRGTLRDVTLNEDMTVDFWIDDVYYKLFDYDWGVIEI